jgi:hypothetical protein
MSPIRQIFRISVFVIGVGLGSYSTAGWVQFAVVSLRAGADYYQQAIFFGIVASFPVIFGMIFLVLSLRHTVPLSKALGRAGFAMMLTGLPLIVLGATFAGLAVPWPK